MYRQSGKTCNISSRCSHNMVNVGPLMAKIVSGVWGTPANFNGFRILASLLDRHHSLEVNQALHNVWPSPGLLHYIYIFGGLLPPNGILPGAKFTLCPSLALSYIGSVTAWHSSSGHQPDCGMVSSGDRVAIPFDSGWWNCLVISIIIIIITGD